MAMYIANENHFTCPRTDISLWTSNFTIFFIQLLIVSNTNKCMSQMLSLVNECQ